MRKLFWALPFLAVGLYGCTETETAGETTVTVDATDTSADTGESTTTATTTGATQIEWASNYDEALAMAKAEGKPVMVKFTAEWCGPCKEMDAEAFTNSDVTAEIDKLIAVKVYDTDPKYQELSSKYGAGSFPTLVFIKNDESVIDSVVGYRGVDATLASLRQVNSVQ